MTTPSDDTCETCDDTGYIWREGPDGEEWLYDCDNDDCNAFGQHDEWVNPDLEGKG